jgi:hypothetical protein
MDILERTARARRAAIFYSGANKFAQHQVHAALRAGARPLTYRSCQAIWRDILDRSTTAGESEQTHSHPIQPSAKACETPLKP